MVIALCHLSLKREAALFARALAFDGNSRERILALHVGYRIYSRTEPVLSNCALMAKNPWVIEKASPERVKALNELEENVITQADKLIEYALEQGDVKFSPGIGSDAIVFANWAMAFGSNALSQNATNSRCIQRLQDPYSILHNANMLLDGINWKPLSSEWDYRKSWRRIESELFSEEVKYLESVGR